MTSDRLTLEDLYRQRMSLSGECPAHGGRELWLHETRQGKWWKTPVATLFIDGRFTCADCRAPLRSITIKAAGNLMFPGEVVGTWVRS